MNLCDAPLAAGGRCKRRISEHALRCYLHPMFVVTRGHDGLRVLVDNGALIDVLVGRGGAPVFRFWRLREALELAHAITRKVTQWDTQWEPGDLAGATPAELQAAVDDELKAAIT